MSKKLFVLEEGGGRRVAIIRKPFPSIDLMSVYYFSVLYFFYVDYRMYCSVYIVHLIL